MEQKYLGRSEWERACKAIVNRCVRRCLTPIHYIMILGQEIDALLQRVPPQYQASAIEMARQFGYETAEERRALQDWVQHPMAPATPVANGVMAAYYAWDA